MQPVCDDYFKQIEAPLGPSSAHLTPFVRAYLDAARVHLLELHDAGAPSRQVNEEHAELFDRLIRKLFRLAEDRYFDHFPRLNFRLAVIAVGGYGRRELSLGSDLDLLFLHRGKLNPYVETIAEAITHRLWDARLIVGASTRTLRDCLRVGREDLSTLTAFLDARFLIGDPELFAELDSEIRQWMRRDGRRFIEDKLAEQQARHERFGESLFLLQPNVRESVGALRDYHTAQWVARASQWEVRRPEHLHLHGFIDAHELENLLAALDFFWRVRFQLHRSGRREDRLHFESQELLAGRFGFSTDDPLLNVENFMRAYYMHARSISRVNSRVIDHALALRDRRRGHEVPASHPAAEDFAIAEGRLQISGASLLRERPVRLLAAFAVAQHHDVEISVRAQRIIRQSISLIDDDFRTDPEAADLFRQVLGAPVRVYRSLKLMDELGVLGAYIPEFASLVGLWQRDLYHTYTVDVHSLFLVEQLRRLGRGRFREELPLPSEFMREVRSPVVLFLSCLLHDVGKGKGGGHSERGAQAVPAVCERLGMTADDTEMVQFLVRHHLTMSGMAERRDVHDPRVILRLANIAETRDHLRNLYLITVADIRSVSPVAWTNWKAGLLEALYRNAAEWLETGVEEAAAGRFFLERAAERVDKAQRESVERVAASGGNGALAREFLDSMPRRYLLAHSPAELASHTSAALSFISGDERLGVFQFTPSHEDSPFWGLLVLGRDQPGLFSTVAGVLTASMHDILAAQVYTARGGLAVEIYQVKPIAGGREEAERECRRIEQRLRGVLAGELSLDSLIARRGSERPQTLRMQPPSVRIANDESDFYTIIDVSTNDRPALLYDITRTLAEFELDVVMSRAATRASRVTDAFYVTHHGHKITDPAKQEEVRNSLLRAILPEGE